jgi:signal peptidase I
MVDSYPRVTAGLTSGTELLRVNPIQYPQVPLSYLRGDIMNKNKIIFSIFISMIIAFVISIMVIDTDARDKIYISQQMNNISSLNLNFTENGDYIIHGDKLRVSSTKLSTSMVPTIQPGQNVLVSDNISNVKVGDIVIYKYDPVFAEFEIHSTYVIHRIIYLNDTHFIAQGDNNIMEDGLYPRSALRSVVFAVLY